MESLHNLQTFDNPGPLLARGIPQGRLKLRGLLLQIDGLEKLLDGLGSHSYPETVSVLLPHILIFPLGENLLILQLRIPCVQHNVGGKIQHLLQSSGGEVQDQAHTAGDSFKIPDMGHGSSQLNMPHALPADIGLGNFHAAAIADYAFIADFLILSAVTLPVLAGSEDAFTE